MKNDTLDRQTSLSSGWSERITSNIRKTSSNWMSTSLKGKSEVDVEGYRDYRGVPVIGAWTGAKIDRIQRVSGAERGGGK